MYLHGHDTQLQVDTWFGPQTTQSEFENVTAVFDTMATTVQDSVYNCPPFADNACQAPDDDDFWEEPDHCGCTDMTYAYVYPHDTNQVQSLECHGCC